MLLTVVISVLIASDIVLGMALDRVFCSACVWVRGVDGGSNGWRGEEELVYFAPAIIRMLLIPWSPVTPNLSLPFMG